MDDGAKRVLAMSWWIDSGKNTKNIKLIRRQNGLGFKFTILALIVQKRYGSEGRHVFTADFRVCRSGKCGVRKRITAYFGGSITMYQSHMWRAERSSLWVMRPDVCHLSGDL